MAHIINVSKYSFYLYLHFHSTEIWSVMQPSILLELYTTTVRTKLNRHPRVPPHPDSPSYPHVGCVETRLQGSTMVSTRVKGVRYVILYTPFHAYPLVLHVIIQLFYFCLNHPRCYYCLTKKPVYKNQEPMLANDTDTNKTIGHRNEQLFPKQVTRIIISLKSLVYVVLYRWGATHYI